MRRTRSPWLLSLILLAMTPATFAQGPSRSPAAPPQAGAHARLSAVAGSVAAAYDPAKGTFRGTGWWNSANGITALADAARTLPSSTYDHLFPAAFDAAQRQAPGFLNEFYDDEGWWALAWLDVYRSHPDPRYLAMARSIFADMQGGWSDTCGGGIWWKKNVHYKNAIANELFLAVAVGLAEASPGSQRPGYLAWAEREKSWFLQSGMLNGDFLVNDGLTDSCKNNGKATWTYNQGVLIGGLAGLSRLTGDPDDLAVATRVATAAATHLTDANGVLHDPCEPGCGGDGVQFKGILARNLATLQSVAPNAAVAHTLAASAESAWEHAQTSKGDFACNWSGPPADGGTGALISVLDLLTTQVAVSPKAPGR